MKSHEDFTYGAVQFPGSISDFRFIPEDDEYECPAGQRATWRFGREEAGQMVHKYWSSACPHCPLKAGCTTGRHRRITRTEYEDITDRMQKRLDNAPQAMSVRRQTAEHPFGTLKAWMGATHFQTKTMKRVSTEMSLHIFAYNLKRMIQIFGMKNLLGVMGA